MELEFCSSAGKFECESRASSSRMIDSITIDIDEPSVHRAQKINCAKLGGETDLVEPHQIILTVRILQFRLFCISFALHRDPLAMRAHLTGALSSYTTTPQDYCIDFSRMLHSLTSSHSALIFSSPQTDFNSKPSRLLYLYWVFYVLVSVLNSADVACPQCTVRVHTLRTNRVGVRRA